MFCSCLSGDCYDALGDFEEGIKCHERHLQLAIALQNPRDQERAYCGLGLYIIFIIVESMKNPTNKKNQKNYFIQVIATKHLEIYKRHWCV